MSVPALVDIHIPDESYRMSPWRPSFFDMFITESPCTVSTKMRLFDSFNLRPPEVHVATSKLFRSNPLL